MCSKNFTIYPLIAIFVKAALKITCLFNNNALASGETPTAEVPQGVQGQRHLYPAGGLPSQDPLLCAVHFQPIFTARRFASAVLATAIPSVCPSVTRRYCVNFDNKGRKVCCKVSLYKNSQRQSCSAVNCLSTGINILGGATSSITHNKNSTRAFQRAINQGSILWFYAAPNFLKMGIKYLNLSSFAQFRQ